MLFFNLKKENSNANCVSFSWYCFC